MCHTAPVEEGERAQAGSMLFATVGVLLLGIALFISFVRPEWINFLWLSVATIASAAFAGWGIGRLLDILFEDLS